MRLAWLVLGSLFVASSLGADGAGDAQARTSYWQALDDWVDDGGPESELKSRVNDICGKLVLATVDSSEWAALLTMRQGELAFRTDVCVKATLHRVRPQPEFSNPLFVEMICRNAQVMLYRELCGKADLLPDSKAI